VRRHRDWLRVGRPVSFLPAAAAATTAPAPATLRVTLSGLRLLSRLLPWLLLRLLCRLRHARSF